MSNNRQTKKEGFQGGGGCSFYIQNELKCEILNGKKFIKKLFFSVITTKKNLKWEISTKNSVTLKDGMGLRMKNVNNMGVHWKIWFLGGCMKNQYIGGWTA